MSEVVALGRDTDAVRALENAVVRLLKRRPFYGHFLLSFNRRTVRGGPPIGATLKGGTPTLIVHHEALAGYGPRGQEALLEHALKHILHLHPLRRKERHALTWDAASDLALNPGIDNLPAEAACPERFGLEPGLAAEEYYQELSRPFDTGNLEGEGVGNASANDSSHAEAADGGLEGVERGNPLEAFAPIDDHGVWDETDSTPIALGEEVVRGMVREAYRKSRGEVPGDVRELVESMLAPSPIPWRQVLRQFVATAGRIGRQGTWKREHRRFAHATPGIRKRRRLNLLVAVDVSDSTDDRELREAFARELVQIARGRDSRITVLYSGSRIQRIDNFTSSAAVVEVYEGGGFTDLRPVFDYAQGMQPRPAAVIYLTDGFGAAPETMALPTLWVLTRDGQKPAEWGVELRLDV